MKKSDLVAGTDYAVGTSNDMTYGRMRKATLLSNSWYHTGRSSSTITEGKPIGRGSYGATTGMLMSHQEWVQTRYDSQEAAEAARNELLLSGIEVVRPVQVIRPVWRPSDAPTGYYVRAYGRKQRVVTLGMIQMTWDAYEALVEERRLARIAADDAKALQQAAEDAWEESLQGDLSALETLIGIGHYGLLATQRRISVDLDAEQLKVLVSALSERAAQS